MISAVLLHASVVFGQIRIVTAGSVVTETVCALGDCDKIVASDRTSLYPAHIQSLPSIGYRSSINAEGILSLRPDLVIVEKDYVDEAVLSQLRSSRIAIVMVEQQFSFEGAKETIEVIAKALNRNTEGEGLIAKIEGELAEAQSWVAQSKESPKVLGVHNRGTALVNIAGEKTFTDIFPYVGATNAIKGVKGYKSLNSEALIASNPDYILFFDSGLQSLGGVAGALKIQGVAQTTAGKKKQIIAIEGIKLSNFGPRFGEAVKELTLLLHPEIQKP